jgi:hypothetical protein
MDTTRAARLALVLSVIASIVQIVASVVELLR